MSESESVRVGVIGAAGSVGATVCEAVDADDDLELVAAFDPSGGSAHGVNIATSIDALVDAGVEVAVDFTQVEPARTNVPWLGDHGIHAVVGTTGFSASDLADFSEHFTASNCIIAPNFAISAVLMMRFAELAAPYFDTAEIIELHHDNKIDAPSGTAMATAERMAAASDHWADDPTEHHVVVGARGGKGPGGIAMHSVRMRGMVAHQDVILGALGQTLTLRQDSYHRSSFMPGVLLAIRGVGRLDGVVVGLDALIDI